SISNSSKIWGTSSSISSAIRTTSAGLWLLSRRACANPGSLSGASAFNSNCGDDDFEDVVFGVLTSQILPFVRHYEADVFILRLLSSLQFQPVPRLRPVKIFARRRRQLGVPRTSTQTIFYGFDQF